MKSVLKDIRAWGFIGGEGGGVYMKKSRTKLQHLKVLDSPQAPRRK